VTGRGGHSHQRRRDREELVCPRQQAGELARRWWRRRSAHQEVARGVAGSEAAEAQDLLLAGLTGGKRGEGLAQRWV